MFSAVAHKNLAGAEGYFDEHLSQNDYYAAGEVRPGQWIGRGAERLGLQPGQVVSREQFKALCENQNPDTGERLTQRSQKEGQRRVFYDFTCSAPKSISVLAVTLDDNRLVEAHAAQGKTVNEVLVVASSRSLPAVHQEQFYVSISRGRERCQVFTDDAELLRSHVTHSSVRLAAVEAMPARQHHDFVQTILQRGSRFLKQFRQRIAQSLSIETSERSRREIKPTEPQQRVVPRIRL